MLIVSKILIAYISKTGTTKEISEEIGKIIEENGFQVEIRDMLNVQSLEDCSAIILGAPINGFRWLPEAEKFIADHKAELSNIPTAYFIVSYLLKAGRPSLQNKMKGTLKNAKGVVAPVFEGYFGGKVDSSFPAVFRLMFGVKKGTPYDVRDWDEIRAWAKDLASKLKA